jgi:hypothetical protein
VLVFARDSLVLRDVGALASVRWTVLSSVTTRKNLKSKELLMRVWGQYKTMWARVWSVGSGPARTDSHTCGVYGEVKHLW